MLGLPTVQPAIDTAKGVAQQASQVAESVNTAAAPAAEAVRDGIEQVRALDSDIPGPAAAEARRYQWGEGTGRECYSIIRSRSMQTVNIKKDFLNVKKLEADNDHVRMTYGQSPRDRAIGHAREAKQQASLCRGEGGLVREEPQPIHVRFIDPAQRDNDWNELRELRRTHEELRRLMPDPDEIVYPSLGAALIAAARYQRPSQDQMPFSLFILIDYHPVSWGQSIERIHVDTNVYRSGFRICGCIGVDGNPRHVLSLASTVQVPAHNTEQPWSHHVQPLQMKNMLWTGRKHSDLLRYVSIGNKKYRNTALATSGAATAESTS